MIEQTEQGTPEWFEKRKGRVTGSNVGAILGLNPWRTADDVLRAMVRDYHGAEKEFKGNVATGWGSFHEAGAATEYTMETGNPVEPCGFFVHPEHNWLGASPDGLIGDDGLIEIKSPYSQRGKTPPAFKSAIEQPHYWAQVQIALACAGRKWCHFLQWSPHGTRLEEVRLDLVWFDDALPKLLAFYERYLGELDNPLHLIDATTAGGVFAELGELRIKMQADKEREAELVEQIVAMCQGRPVAIPGAGKVTRVERKGSVSYAKVLSEHLPDLDVEPYRGESSVSWRVSIDRGVV